MEVLVGQYAEGTDNADLTQTLLQLRARRRPRTVTTSHQTDRLAVHTYADAVTQANPNETTDRVVTAETNHTATSDTTDTAQGRTRVTTARAARADRRVRVRQALTSDADSAANTRPTITNDPSRDDDDTTQDTPRRRSSRHRYDAPTVTT